MLLHIFSIVLFGFHHIGKCDRVFYIHIASLNYIFFLFISFALSMCYRYVLEMTNIFFRYNHAVKLFRSSLRRNNNKYKINLFLVPFVVVCYFGNFPILISEWMKSTKICCWYFWHTLARLALTYKVLKMEKYFQCKLKILFTLYFYICLVLVAKNCFEREKRNRLMFTFTMQTYIQMMFECSNDFFLVIPQQITKI